MSLCVLELAFRRDVQFSVKGPLRRRVSRYQNFTRSKKMSLSVLTMYQDNFVGHRDSFAPLLLQI